MLLLQQALDRIQAHSQNQQQQQQPSVALPSQFGASGSGAAALVADGPSGAVGAPAGCSIASSVPGIGPDASPVALPARTPATAATPAPGPQHQGRPRMESDATVVAALLAGMQAQAAQAHMLAPQPEFTSIGSAGGGAAFGAPSTTALRAYHAPPVASVSASGHHQPVSSDVVALAAALSLLLPQAQNLHAQQQQELAQAGALGAGDDDGRIDSLQRSLKSLASNAVNEGVGTIRSLLSRTLAVVRGGSRDNSDEEDEAGEEGGTGSGRSDDRSAGAAASPRSTSASGPSSATSTAGAGAVVAGDGDADVDAATKDVGTSVASGTSPSPSASPRLEARLPTD